MSTLIDPIQKNVRFKDVEYGQSGSSSNPKHGDCNKSTWLATINVSKAVLGIGMFVIPNTFVVLSAPLASLLILILALIAWFILSSLISLGGHNLNQPFYKTSFGKVVYINLFPSLLICCFALCIDYLALIIDILLGVPPQSLGLVFDFFPEMDANIWYMRPPFIQAAFSAFVLSPILFHSDVSYIFPLNSVGVVSAIAIAAINFGIASSRVIHGTAFSIPLMPDWTQLGASPSQVAASLAGVVPFVMISLLCHQSILSGPFTSSPCSLQSMDCSIRQALLFSCAIYIANSLCLVVAFGPDLQPYFLENFSVAMLEPIVGISAAGHLSSIVKFFFLLSLVGSFACMFYPLRQVLLEALQTQAPANSNNRTTEGKQFIVVTVVLLVAISGISIAVPYYWDLLYTVITMSTNLTGLVFPALILLLLNRTKHQDRISVTATTTAFIILAMGSVLFVNDFVLYVWA